MGGVTGFDMPAFLEAARIQGCDIEAMMILLPYGETGLLEAMKEEREKT